MTSLSARVLASIRRRRLCDPGARVVAAVSGGADSVALAHLLAELSRAGAVTLVGLAHLDHRLRGAESTRDREFCSTLAASLGVPFESDEIDVLGEARRRGESVEQAARSLRYAFLERARLRLDADLVAVAHTRDDQAETVLLRILRGTGTRGLAAILPLRDRVVRPLLDLRREDLLRYLEQHGCSWVEDSTNQDRRILRNWIRHELLPFIASRTGEGITDVLARTADIAREDEALLDRLAADAERRLDRQSPDGRALDGVGLGLEPPAVARRVVRRVLESEGGSPAVWAHVAAALELAAKGAPGSVRAGGCDVELSAAGGVLYFRVPRSPGHVSPVQAQELPVPGTVELPESGLRLRAERRELEDVGGFAAVCHGGPTRAVIPATTVAAGLFVRAWRPGDALQPMGLSGRKKVQDLFVDRKVPRAMRHSVPIVTAADGQIVWVTGHALGEPFRVTPATKSVVVLSFESLGGS
jgi:tRNA(Ile)-lysidine synthase